ncbi:MAG: sensor histidine kinase [Lysobacterales bacterium]
MTNPFFSKQWLFQLAFWSVVFLLNVGPDWHKYSSLREVLEVVGTTTSLQAMVAWVALRYLVPGWLDRGQVKRFGLLLLGVLWLAAELNIWISYSYLEPAYPDSYGKSYAVLSHLSLIERLGFSPMIKYIVFSKLPLLLFPAAALIAVNYYMKQSAVLALREQKRAAELEALKNQLNPHFIFNTLNNIYALAIKQSEQTPEAVAKLSGILDYVLYRCNSQYVSLEDEVAMIEDYVALERLRFSDRLTVSFTNHVHETVYVAPLLFLTLIENAFKHGAGQALGQASVDLSLSATDQHIKFEVSNTKPAPVREEAVSQPGIGLDNLRKQLGLLYPNAHSLEIAETERRYAAHLILSRVTP